MTLTTPVLPDAPEPLGPARPLPVRVVAVLVAHDGARWLPRALRALADQTRRPDVVRAVDTGSTDESLDLLRAALGADHVTSAPRRTGFGAAVSLALGQVAEVPAGAPDRAGDPASDWIWLLHDDSAPDPRALEHLLDAATASDRVGVVGPKLVAWDDPTRLLEVGVTVSRGGRREDCLDGAVRDQGQHDGRCDVLAVSTAGMLVRRDLWDRLGGLDPALPLLRDDVDLCWRAHLAGARVVVAPRAVVADAQAASRRLRPADAVHGRVRRADRRHGLQVALARCALWAVPLVLAQLVVQGLGRAAGLLAAKAPRAALDELLAVAAVLCAPWRWIGSRWRSRGTRRVPRSTVAGLLVPRSAVFRRAADAVVAWRRTPGEPASTGATGVPPEPGPTADEAQPQLLAPARWPRRVARAPLTWVLLGLAATTAAASRALVGTGSLTGGALGPVSGNGPTLWQDAVGTLRGPGLGTAGAAPPSDVLRAGAVRALQLIVPDRAAVSAVDLLVLGAPVLSAITAYLAAATATRSRAARAWAAAVWGASPLLMTATAQGRLGPVVVHLLLPLAAAALARTLAPRGTVTALAAAVLALVLVGSLLPSVLALGLLVALAGVLLGRGPVRLRAALLLVLVPAALGPWLLELVARPALVLAGPGAVDVGPAASGAAGWRSLLRLVESVVSRPSGWPAWTLAVPFAPLALAGLLALLRGGGRGRAATSAWGVALLAVAGALVLPHVVLAGPLAGGAGAALHGWPGGLLDVAVLGLLAAALVGVDGLRGRLAGRRGRWRRVALAPLVLVCVLVPLAAAGGAAWRGTQGPLERSPATTLPAVSADAAAGPRATRTLVLGVTSGVVTYRLAGREPQPWTRNLPGREPGSTWPQAAAPARLGADVEARAVDALLAEGVAADPAEGASPGDPVPALRRLAVGFVLVEEPVPGATVERLDSLGGLTRIGSPHGGRLWRVGGAQDPDTARVQVLDPSGTSAAVVPVGGAHAAVDTTIAAGPDGRRLVLSEVASPAWRATLDGRRLVPSTTDGDWRQAFALPASGGRLVVQHVDPVRDTWHWAQLALVALLALLAVPVRRPRDDA